jgi:hypothetical protein
VIITFICSDRPEDQIRVQLRFRNSADAINRTRFHLAHVLDLGAFVQNTPYAQKICARSDLLVIYRYLYGPVLQAIQYWKARNKRIIVDFDQAIEHLAPGLPDYSFWLEGEPLSIASGNLSPASRIDPLPLEQFRWGLEMVDAATVASARLASDWSQFATVYEIPDYLNPCQYPVFEHDHGGEVWIGLGPSTHYTAFEKSGLTSALEHLCREHLQVKLVLGSLGNEAGMDLKIDPHQVVTYSCASFGEWVYLLLTLDIGLVPAYSDFDLRLSPVHLLEFMIAKIPWIASSQLSIHELPGYGQWVQNAPQAWESAILRVIDRLDLYKKRAGGEPFLYALGQDAGAHIDKALRIYSAILNR